MDHDPTIRELLLDLLSEDQKTVIQAGKKLSDLWSGHKDDSPDFDGSLFDKSTTAFDKAVHRILHSEGFPSEALLRKCLMLYVDGQNRRVGYLNGSDWICDPDWDGLTLGSITGTILMQAGSAAASIKDEILDVMDVTVGDPNGLSSTSHLDWPVGCFHKWDRMELPHSTRYWTSPFRIRVRWRSKPSSTTAKTIPGTLAS